MKNDFKKYEGLQTIDCTPTWVGITPIIIAGLQDGDRKGKEIAKQELTNMAKVADLYVAISKNTRTATNFDFRISKAAAMELIKPVPIGESGCLAEEMGIEIMCKEYGEDDEWVGLVPDDYDNIVDDEHYKTFEVWLPTKREQITSPYINQLFAEKIPTSFPDKEYKYTIEHVEDRAGKYYQLLIFDIAETEEPQTFDYNTYEEATKDIETANNNTDIDFQDI